MNPGGLGKHVVAHNGFVIRNPQSRKRLDNFTNPVQRLLGYAQLQVGHKIAEYGDCACHRRVTRPFTEAVHGQVDTMRARPNGLHDVGNAEVVVVMSVKIEVQRRVSSH